METKRHILKYILQSTLYVINANRINWTDSPTTPLKLKVDTQLHPSNVGFYLHNHASLTLNSWIMAVSHNNYENN